MALLIIIFRKYVAFADSRIRPETIAAEDVLHGMGVFSMMSSDSLGYGYVLEKLYKKLGRQPQQNERGGALPEETGG